MVLEFAIDPTAVIDMEAANPVDEPELTMHWIRERLLRQMIFSKSSEVNVNSSTSSS